MQCTGVAGIVTLTKQPIPGDHGDCERYRTKEFMAGPTASVLVSLPSPPPTWRDVLLPYASEWLDNQFCWISDTKKFGGTYAGESRPFVGNVDRFIRTEESSLHSISEIDAVESAMNRTFTHSIVVAAMCNDPSDHRVLCEIVTAIAEQLAGIVDFDSIDAPSREIGMHKCFWTDDDHEYWTMLGDANSGKLWMNHPSFHMIK